MGEIQLLHHVYTSISGYKTVYSSPEIKPNVLTALEAFSDTIYPRVRQKTLRSIYHPSPEHICISRVFRSSADHAGRQRSCVHNILVSKKDLFESRYINPFELPESLFLNTAPEAAFIPSLKKRLPNKLALGSPSVADLKIDDSVFTTPLGQTIFSAVTSNHDMAIISPSYDCYDFLAAAGDMLPPFLRLSTAVVSGTIYRSAYTEGATAYQLTPGYDTEMLTTEGVITYDTTSGRTANLPAPNKYFAFIASNIDENNELVRKLVAVIHKYPLSRISTNDMYHNLVRAFTETSGCFDDDGSVCPVSDMDAILKYLLAFYQSGHTSIVIDVLRQAFNDLEKKGEISGSAEILKQLETSLDDPQVQLAQKEAAISRLSGWLARTYSKSQ